MDVMIGLSREDEVALLGARKARLSWARESINIGAIVGALIGIVTGLSCFEPQSSHDLWLPALIWAAICGILAAWPHDQFWRRWLWWIPWFR